MKILFFGLVACGSMTGVSAQQISYYSDKMKANVSIDTKTLQSSNSRGFSMLLDEGEEVVSHQLEGVGTQQVKKKELEDQLTIIRQVKKEALQLIDRERKNYVEVVQRAKAAAAAGRASQYQPTTHHDFYSPAYEQLKHINATGSWN